MKVLLVEPGKAPKETELEDTLEAMQKAVGGLMEAVYPFEDTVALICNEEGKLLGLPLNRALYSPEDGKLYDIVAGTFFLCSAPADSEKFDSLSEEQLRHYRRLFQMPELFLRLNGRLAVLPAKEETPT
jgi:hypothetical protein